MKHENHGQPTPAETAEPTQPVPSEEPAKGQPPTGDWPLQRLRQFEKERGLPESDVDHPERDQSSLEETDASTPDTPCS